MKNSLRKAAAGVMLAAVASLGVGTTAQAVSSTQAVDTSAIGTVFTKIYYYKSSPVTWRYGVLFSGKSAYIFSSVQNASYEHGASANTNFSGWKQPGVTATAISPGSAGSEVRSHVRG